MAISNNHLPWSLARRKEITVPEEKAINLLEEFADPSITKATVKQLQQLCGFLNFLCRAIVPGHAFTRRMYAKYSNIVKIDVW